MGILFFYVDALDLVRISGTEGWWVSCSRQCFNRFDTHIGEYAHSSGTRSLKEL